MTQNHLPEWEAMLPIETVARIHDRLKACDKMRAEHTIYPPQDKVLNALALTAPREVKVVIVGQDPYHGKGQAMGLAFSVAKGMRIPPSLRNVYAELHDDLGIETPEHGDLTAWAERGVLLLNASLSVIEGEPNSMANFGWGPIVDSLLRTTMLDPSPKVYLCWGSFAHNLVSSAMHSVDRSSLKGKYLIRTTHPSPFSAANATKSAAAFLGSRQFSTANEILVENGVEPVDWRLE